MNDLWGSWFESSVPITNCFIINGMVTWIDHNRNTHFYSLFALWKVNGTSSGFAPDFDAEDNLHVRELVLERLNSKIMTRFPPPGSDETAEAAAQEG